MFGKTSKKTGQPTPATPPAIKDAVLRHDKTPPCVTIEGRVGSDGRALPVYVTPLMPGESRQCDCGQPAKWKLMGHVACDKDGCIVQMAKGAVSPSADFQVAGSR